MKLFGKNLTFKIQKPANVIIFGKSFQVGELPAGNKTPFGEQMNIPGMERKNHKYIKREPDPKRPGKYIYYYKLADGSIQAKDEEGNSYNNAVSEDQQTSNNGRKPESAFGEQLDIFQDLAQFIKDRYIQTEHEAEFNEKKNIERKIQQDRYEAIANDELKNTSFMSEFYFAKAAGISEKLNLEKPDRNNKYYFIKPKSFLISEINQNVSLGKGAKTDGGFIHHFISEKPENIIGEYEKEGYKLSLNAEDYIEDEFKDHKFDKYIAEKDNERFEVWVMSKQMYDAFVDTQKKSSERLKESKLSLALKIEAEKVKEFPQLLQKYQEKGLSKKELIVIGGLPGSGKSTVLGNTLQKSGVVVDPDSIKFDLGEIRGTDIEDINKNPYKYHEESSVVAKHLLRELLRVGKKCVFDGTMKGIANVGDLISLAESAGYKTEAKFIHIPLEEGIKRDRKRGESGGRSIGEKLYRKLYSSYPTHKALFTLMPKFNEVRVYDNSTPINKPAIEVYRKSAVGEKVLSQKRFDLIKTLSKMEKSIQNMIRKSRFIINNA